MKRIYISNSIQTIEVIAELAISTSQLSKGLMYRKILGRNAGMLFFFPTEAHHAMHMKNTSIPLDIIFIDANKKITDIKQGKPHSLSFIHSSLPFKYVLEVHKDFCKFNNIKLGDAVRI